MYSVEHSNALLPSEYIYIAFLLTYFKQNWMSSTTLILAIQARSFNQCKNLRSKILKCCANIYCNPQCLKKNLSLLYSTEYIYIYIYIYILFIDLLQTQRGVLY